MRVDFLLGGFLLVLSALGQRGVTAAEPTVDLRAGDRIVWLGATFVERMQSYGYLETQLTASLATTDLTFRNLGWSGDNVLGEARAVFGTAEEGFERLKKDLAEARPTVIVLSYGGNEAHWGADGADDYRKALEHLVEACVATDARLVFIAPRRYEKLAPPLPDPTGYNRLLRQYTSVSRDVVTAAGGQFLDAYDLGQEPLTENGVHLTAYGYWFVASEVASWFGAPADAWQVTIDATSLQHESSGTEVSQLQRTDRGLQFTCLDKQLPASPFPSRRPPQAPAASTSARMTIRDLPPGNYALRSEENVFARGSEKEWSDGISLWTRAGTRQTEQLRATVQKKNELYFHRYRPQNETYLFLFRKHEQGNNAVEIPQFDPLVEAAEAVIHELKHPQPQRYELVKEN